MELKFAEKTYNYFYIFCNFYIFFVIFMEKKIFYFV